MRLFLIPERALGLLTPAALLLSSCGGATGVSSAPPPPSITVEVTPAAKSVPLGGTIGFSAQVMGSSDTVVTWRVNGTPGGTPATGTVDASGNYTAPRILPASPAMTITAVSHADANSSGSSTATVTSDVVVTVSPSPPSLEPGAQQQFTAQVTGAGNPLTTVSWSVNGPACNGAGTPCGSISVSGVYTAPGSPPQPDSVTITATSLADPSKSASAQTQIQQTFTVTPSTATVALEQQAQFTSILNGAATTAVQWTVDGFLAGNPTVGTISDATQLNGLYTAPVNMVAARMVTVTATSLSNPQLSASSSVSLTSNIVVQVSPPSATRVLGAQQLFSATVSNTSNPSLEWRVNGIPGGDMVSGRICVVGSMPCQTPPSGLPPGSVEYEAPPAVPSPAQVTVAAVSLADNAKFGSAVVTVAAQISVNVSPPSVTLPPTGVQPFMASVVGISDQNVTWDLNGTVNGDATVGVLCLSASNPCQAPAGAMSGPIEYRAPAAPPSPNPVILSATSEVDSTAQQMAAITIGTGPYVFSLLPASVTAGAANPFPLLVQGVQFIPSNPGPGSTVLIDGVARSTECPSTNECSVTLDPVDVASAGNKSITIANPASPPTSSNSAAFFIVPPDTTVDVIALDVSTPVATSKDIVVVEPTTAGLSPPDALTLQAIALFDTQANSCNVQAAVVTLARPISGVNMVDLCLVGTRLDTVTAISVSSPSAADVTLSNLDTTLGSIVLRFTAAIPSTAQPGPRTIFVETANSDKAALSGGLEVK